MASRRILLIAATGVLLIAPAALAKSTQFQLPACDTVMNIDTGVKRQPMEAIHLDTDATAPGAKPLSKHMLDSSLKVGPLSIIPSQQESDKKTEAINEAERRQLADLWNAAVTRSPDIQFVIDALFPTSEKSHTTTKMVRSLGAALFGVAQAAPMMMGPGLKSVPMGAGANMIKVLFDKQSEKDAKQQSITQEQAAMLYKIVRDTADKLVVEYRQYRRCQGNLTRAYQNVQDFQGLAEVVRPTLKPVEALQLHYTLSCIERDRDNAEDEVRMHQRQLVDLAGSDAVANLNSQIYEEQLVLEKLTGGKEFDPGLKLAPQGTANEGLPPAKN